MQLRWVRVRVNIELESDWGPDKETIQGNISCPGTNHMLGIAGSCCVPKADCDLSKIPGVTAALIETFTWQEPWST